MVQPNSPLRVLVVDDDPVLIDLIPWLLSVLGHIVETADSGRLALLRLARSPSLDVVLIDLRMPGMDGATLAEAIAAHPHPPHLIGMSGADPTADQASLFQAFLHKPFDIETLKQALNDSGPQPGARPAASVPLDPIVLDTAIYHRLAASMPPEKLRDLYHRTLDYVVRTAPSFDTASETSRAELAHSLQGSCAMVGAVELATLAQQLGNASQSTLDALPGASPESSFSYKILRAAERLERILKSIQAL